MRTSIEDSPTSDVENNTAIEMEALENAVEDIALTPAIEMTDVYKRYRQNCVSVLNGLDLKKCHSQKV